jgi:hypothetical protein
MDRSRGPPPNDGPVEVAADRTVLICVVGSRGKHAATKSNVVACVDRMKSKYWA